MSQPFNWELPTPNRGPRHALDLSFEEWREAVSRWGFKPANAVQLFTGLHRRGFERYEQIPLLPKRLRERLGNGALPIDPIGRSEPHPSEDGATKYRFHLHDGQVVEGVYMPHGDRATFCISSQAGCAMGCTFCATGAMGFRRHLGPGEIVSQVYHMIRNHQPHFRQTKRRNVVFMGMGEPLHNLDNVLAAFDLLTHRHGLVLSERDVAVSTSGLVPKIEALARRPKRPQLMVSIAATSDEERSASMPVNRAYGLVELLACLESYPLRKRERIMLSYVLIAGVNDGEGHAHQLAAMARRFPSLVNLIPLNEHEHAPGLREPVEAALQRFYQALLDLGVFATIRRSRGRDVAGACGQLVHGVEQSA